MRDVDVRRVLLERLNGLYSADPNTIVVEELGLCGGFVRVDVAVVNGCLKGYEIKSDRDTLKRLGRQAMSYGKVLDTVTLVSGETHLAQAAALLPEWWGIEVAEFDEQSGKTHLVPFRSEKPNPEIEPIDLAQLLWRDEVLSILDRVVPCHNLAQKPRKHLWKALVEAVAVDELKVIVRDGLRNRMRWRVDGARTQNDGKSQPCATSSDCPSQRSRSRSHRYTHRPS
jgi:hypothetical protein